MAKFRVPKWAYIALAAVVLLALVTKMGGASAVGGCLDTQTYCPGVGCLSGADKCTPGASGGPSIVFSKEGFEASSFPQWNTAKPPPTEIKRCPGNYHSDGPCLMEFPGL
jgi:hypothetical protein